MSKGAQGLLEIILTETGEMDAANKKLLLSALEKHLSKMKEIIHKKERVKTSKRLKKLETSLKNKYRKERDKTPRKAQLFPKQDIEKIRSSIREEMDGKYLSRLEKMEKLNEELRNENRFLAEQIAGLIRKTESNGAFPPSDISNEEDLPVLLPVEQMELYIDEAAFRKMIEHCSALADDKLEAMGFLMGDEYTFEGHSYTVVKEVVTSELDSSAVSVKISDFSPMFEELHNMEKAGKDYIMVGWYHSHPGHTCFLSATDISTQRRMFKEDFHVAVVVDPVSLELKSFKLDPEEQYREISFAVYSET